MILCSLHLSVATDDVVSINRIILSVQLVFMVSSKSKQGIASVAHWLVACFVTSVQVARMAWALSRQHSDALFRAVVLIIVTSNDFITSQECH